MERANYRSRFRLGVESLEGRKMMAANPFGNVTASVSLAGDLVITGDNLQNNLQVVQAMQNGAPIDGRYFIAPLNGTTLNGQASGQFFDNVSRDIRVNLNGGNDRLTLGNGTVDNNFIVPRDLSVIMGGGADVVMVNHIAVRDDAAILTGDGNDSVTFKGTVGALPGVDAGDNNLFIDTGARPDNVLLQNVFVRHDLTVNTGIDSFSDIVDMHFMNIGNDTCVNTGGGSDLVRVSNVGFNGDLSIDTGAGNDLVQIDQTEADLLFVRLGADSDRLELTNSFGRRFAADGGTGFDTLVRSSDQFIEPSLISSFERLL